MLPTLLLTTLAVSFSPFTPPDPLACDAATLTLAFDDVWHLDDVARAATRAGCALTDRPKPWAMGGRAVLGRLGTAKLPWGRAGARLTLDLVSMADPSSRVYPRGLLRSDLDVMRFEWSWAAPAP